MLPNSCAQTAAPVRDGQDYGLWLIRKTEIRPETGKLECSRAERTKTIIARSALACKLLTGPQGPAGSLLDFDGGDAVELLPDGLGVFLADVLLERLGSAIDKVLGFFQAERGNFTYGLDGVDLIGPGILKDDGEFGLLGRCRSGGSSGSAAGNDDRAAAAAETPRRSSSFFTRAAASSRLRLTI